MNTNQLVNEFINLWDNASIDIPELGDEIDYKEKLRREEGMERFSKKIMEKSGSQALNPSNKKQVKEKFKENMMVYAKNVFNFSDDEIGVISGNGFTSATKEFMKMARKFDSTIQMDDIFQACRNLWIINSLQLLMNEPVIVTPSIFAYSMLYPYSDNYLDNPKVSKSEKLMFSLRFRRRLIGEHVIPANQNEKKIFDLVTLIELDWNRILYPRVYDSLIAIHDAQTKSICLMNDKSNLTESDLLSICIEKGGASVLADGYLINGSLTREQEWFCFGFGTFLQFVDDIQDIEEDIEGQLETMFTNATYNGKLEEFTNRTFSFSNVVMNDMSPFNGSKLEELRSLMKKSLAYLINEAVGINELFYKPLYVKVFEKYSPFRYSFIRKRRKHIEPNRISMMKKIEEYVFQQKETELAFI